MSDKPHISTHVFPNELPTVPVNGDKDALTELRIKTGPDYLAMEAEQRRVATEAALRDKFNTHAPTPSAAALMADNRAEFAELAVRLNRHTAPGRELSLALTNLEQALFWANKAVILADNATTKENHA